ncbi:MAG: hypothetical protein RRA32_05850 [bacterium]|nr:hypothetical protein [bacterium]
MDFPPQNPLMLVTLLAVTFVITLPFGMWRARCRKFTVQWWLAIHLVIPFIFIMRRWGGFTYFFIPLFLASTVLGQIVGGKIKK